MHNSNNATWRRNSDEKDVLQDVYTQFTKAFFTLNPMTQIPEWNFINIFKTFPYVNFFWMRKQYECKYYEFNQNNGYYTPHFQTIFSPKN